MQCLQRDYEILKGRGIFDSYWHLIGHRRELPGNGDYVKFDTPLGDVVFFNDMGNLVAFDNRCPHRGALIYRGDHGNSRFICQYHGWAYQGGKLIIPKKNTFHDCNIDNADINKYKLDFIGDFVFLAVKPLLSLREQIGSTAEILENISSGIDVRSDFNRYRFECSWPLALENALEPYHIPKVHPKTLATLKLGDGVNVIEGLNSVWYAPVNDDRIRRQLSSLRRFFNIKYQYEGYMSIFLFPFSMLSSTYGYSYSLQNFIPTGDLQNYSFFTSRFYSAKTVSESAAATMTTFFKSSASINRRVFDEDHEICKALSGDSWSSEPLKYASDAEAKLVHFRSVLRQVAAS
jgi:phenylpropionate dioxygenase-like ring-hydroxylating dioxygenase large terminal subunit